jgi:hypothetical protein
MPDGQRSFKNFRTRLRVPDEGTCSSILVGPANVVRAEHQTSNGFRIVSTFASIADWSPHEQGPPLRGGYVTLKLD